MNLVQNREKKFHRHILFQIFRDIFLSEADYLFFKLSVIDFFLYSEVGEIILNINNLKTMNSYILVHFRYILEVHTL